MTLQDFLKEAHRSVPHLSHEDKLAWARQCEATHPGFIEGASQPKGSQPAFHVEQDSWAVWIWRILVLLVLLAICASILRAQDPNIPPVVIRFTGSNPNGNACSFGSPIFYYQGVQYTCANNATYAAGITIPVGSAGITRQFVYDPAAGPCANGVVVPSNTVSDAVRCATGAGTAVSGICIAGCGVISGTATVAIEGAVVNCAFDSATTIRDQVVADIALQGTSPNPWNCFDPGSGPVDLGAPAIGRSLETHGAAGSWPVFVAFASGRDCHGYNGQTFCANTLNFATSANCASSASPAVCGSAVAGGVVVAAGATTVQVNTTAVSGNSQIFLMYDAGLGARLSVTCNTTEPALYGVSSRSAGTSFTITSSAPAVNPACFNYLIMN